MAASPNEPTGSGSVPPGDVTRLLQNLDDHADGASALLPLVYDELRIIARSRMRQERAGHTLQATALVHEVYVKLLAGTEPSWASRGHFFRVAAEAMRRILIDHARRRGSVKRGGDRRSIPLGVLDLADDADPSDVIALDDAIGRLEAEDPRAAEVVKLRFFAGLEVSETAAMLDVSERTVMREWAFARARLAQLLSGDESTDG